MTTPYYTDILVVGAGAAGLVCALNLSGCQVTVLAKAPVGAGASSAWAQGGVAVALGNNDHADQHCQDTLAVGGGISDPDAVRIICDEGPDAMRQVMLWGAEFDRNQEGTLALGREAAHSARRILHANGDSTGAEIMRALGQQVQRADHIELMDDVTVHDLIVRDGQVVGAWAVDQQGSNRALFARAVVLATGGIGRLYGATTNPVEACGDGIALAAKAGAALADLEFVQFHPTAIATGQVPLPLATEALRGEGAVLINEQGHRFMTDVHPDAELAPRDVVARAIWRTIQEGSKALLDCRAAIGADFPNRFPTVWAACQKAGLDPRHEPIPVTPACHYHMGGVATDHTGRTSVTGLWAVGEVACTGAHGANRLASNSLLEAIVFGKRCAETLRAAPRFDVAFQDLPPAPSLSGIADFDALSAVFYKAAGVERTADGLVTALERVEGWYRQGSGLSPFFFNQVLVVRLILCAALMRQESRGGHYRRDFPLQNPAFEPRVSVDLAQFDQSITRFLSYPSLSESQLP